jgi:DNA-directed RNA polymerase specialized sigma24 family protein
VSYRLTGASQKGTMKSKLKTESTVAQTYPIDTVLQDYQNKIYRLALSISRNAKDAEDILQNTLIKIYRNIKYFKARSKLSTWIYRIAYN